MARRRNPRNKVSDKTQDDTTQSNDNTQVDKQSKAGISGLVEGMLAPVGLTRVRHPYVYTDKYQVPPLVLRQCMPFAALRGGFRLASDDETNDVFPSQINWDPSGVDGTSYFHPRIGMKAEMENYSFEAATPIAYRFVTQVWPFYDRLFRSSLKQAGTDVEFNSFLAITALTTELTSLIQDLNVYLGIATVEDSMSMMELASLFARSYGLYNRSYTRRYESIVMTAAGLPAMRGLTAEVIRIKAPFMPTVSRGSVTAPVEVMPLMGDTPTVSSNGTLVSDILTRCELIVNILRGEYADDIAAMKRHMPYTLGDAGFANQHPILVDPFKTDGLMNSYFHVLNVAGNESDPDRAVLYMLQDAEGVGFLPYDVTLDLDPTNVERTLHTVMPDALPALSLLSQSLWIADNDALDEAFALLTPHIWGAACVVYVNATYTGVLYYQFGQASGANLQPFNWHLGDAICAQMANYNSETFYMPSGQRVNLDVDASLKAIYQFVEDMTDIKVVATIDTLAQTAAAPVVDPAVHATRTMK
jgi:hypothetical protein